MPEQSEFCIHKTDNTPKKLVLRTTENMNHTGYRMVASLCLIAGNFLAFMGIATNVWSANTVRTSGITDTSAFSLIYTYISILLVGGILLIAIGLALTWHARALAAREKT